jgi:hypothetical protein
MATYETVAQYHVVDSDRSDEVDSDEENGLVFYRGHGGRFGSFLDKNLRGGGSSSESNRDSKIDVVAQNFAMTSICCSDDEGENRV